LNIQHVNKTHTHTHTHTLYTQKTVVHNIQHIRVPTHKTFILPSKTLMMMMYKYVNLPADLSGFEKVH